METLESPSLTGNPREWREAKNLKPEQVAEMMRRELGEISRHFTSVTKMEKEGSQKSSTVRAYANAIGVDFYAALQVFESIARQKSLEKKSN